MQIKNYILSITTAVALSTSGNYLAAQETEFKPSGNLWGQVFGDFANKAHNDTLQRGGSVQYKGTTPLSSGNAITASNPTPNAVSNQTNAFQIRRMYLGYDYQFAPNFSANIVLANEQNVDGTGKNTVFLKYANVKWSNIFKLKNTDLVLGQYATCAFATAGNTDGLWSYRSIEKTIMDMHGIDASTDLGASLQGKMWSQRVPDSMKPAFIGYAFQVGNNNGAIPNASNYKKGRVNLYVILLKQKLTIGVYGDYVVQQLTPYKTDNKTFKVYAAYKAGRFRIGAEIFKQTNENSDIYQATSNGVVLPGAANYTSSGVQIGWSVFASGKIVKNKLNVFARMDMYNPNTKFDKNSAYSKAYAGISGYDSFGKLNPTTTFYTQTFYTAGIDWTPNPRMHLMPNIWYNGYNTMMSTTKPGGAGGDLSPRVKSDNDLVYRLTFFFIFNGSKKVGGNGMND